jgi:hypothetical protein
VLSYVQYSSNELIAQMRKDVESALQMKRITLEEAARFLRFYEQGMGAYTYLTSRPVAAPPLVYRTQADAIEVAPAGELTVSKN